MHRRSDAPRHGLRTYYILVATQTLSQIGSRVSFFAVGIAVFAETSRATPLAILSFCQLLPAIFGGGLAGALVDRYDRRRLLILANIGFLATSGLLLASFASGAFQLWHLYVLALVTSSMLAVSGPAFSAAVATLAPDSHRDRANGVGQMKGPAANAIAPAVAGVVYAVVGVAGAILLEIAALAVAIVVLLGIRVPAARRTAEGPAIAGRLWRRSFDGLAFLWLRPPLWTLCLVLSLVTFLMSMLGVLILPYSLARTHSTVAFGIVLTCADLGAIAGAVWMATCGGTRPRIHTVMPALFAAGLVLALAGIARTTVGLAASFLAFMFLLPFVNAATLSIFQAKVPHDLQGRVFGAIGQVAVATTPLALLVAGPLTDKVAEPAVQSQSWRELVWVVGSEAGAGMGLTLVVGGLTTAALSLIVYARPAFRRLEANLPDYASGGIHP